jgi:DNA-directed RNA polymerase subunit RPC12/RpoP
MNERARRPILHLKLGAAAPAKDAEAAPAAPGSVPRPAAAPAPVAYTWKCRPCGAAFTPPSEGPDDEAVRCPSCNARLGKAGDFRADPPPLERLRARAVKVSPPPPVAAKPSRPSGPVVMKVIKKIR